MKEMLKNAGILLAITVIAGFVLGAVYQITKGPIAEAEAAAAIVVKRNGHQGRNPSKMGSQPSFSAVSRSSRRVMVQVTPWAPQSFLARNTLRFFRSANL